MEKIKNINNKNNKEDIINKVVLLFEKIKNKYSKEKISNIENASKKVNNEVLKITKNNCEINNKEKPDIVLEDMKNNTESHIDLAFDSMQIIDYIDFLSEPNNAQYLTEENLSNIKKNLRNDIKNSNKQTEKIIEKIGDLLSEMIKLKTDLKDDNKKIDFLNSLCINGQEVKKEYLDLLNFEFTPFAVVIKMPQEIFFLFNKGSNVKGFCEEKNGFNIIMLNNDINKGKPEADMDIEITKKHEIQHAKFKLCSEILEGERLMRNESEEVQKIVNEKVLTLDNTKSKEKFLILDKEKIDNSEDVIFLKNFFKRRVMDEFLAYSTEMDGQFENMRFREKDFFSKISLDGIMELQISPEEKSENVNYLLNAKKNIQDTIGRECIELHSIIKNFYNNDKYYNFLKNNNPRFQEYEKYSGYGVNNGFNKKKFITSFLGFLTPEKIIELSEEIENAK